MICSGDARGAGKASIDGSSLSKPAVEFRRLWAAKYKRRHVCDAGEVRRTRIIGDHELGNAVQQGQVQQWQGPCKVDTALMSDVLDNGLSFFPFPWGTSDQ